jgi:UDP-N-acetylglucosamine acyltransferase
MHPESRVPRIHPTAAIGERAVVGADVDIGPLSIVEDGARIGGACELGAHAIVRGSAVIGRGCRIDSFAVIGGDPQDLSFDRRVSSGVELGDGVIAREGVTVNRSTSAGAVTRVGSRCMLMANSHVGHDCDVAPDCVLANNVMLAGHVSIGSFTFIGGGAGIHQFVRIGEGVMIAGNASITVDVPPFTMVAERNQLHGLNLVGLRRRGVPRDEIADLWASYRTVYAEREDPLRAAARARAAGTCGLMPSGAKFLAFFAASRRGFARPTRRMRSRVGAAAAEASSDVISP